MDLHVYIHLQDEGAVSVHGILDKILTRLRFVEAQGEHLMAKVSDVQDKLTQVMASVAAETDIDTSIVTLVTGMSATVASLRQELADAIAAGADPAALQTVVDGLGVMQTSIDANKQKIADAVAANTPAA